MLPPRYIRRKIKEKNEDSVRFLIRSLMKLELRTSLCAGHRSEKENRYKRVEQAFGVLSVVGSPVGFGVRNKGLQNR